MTEKLGEAILELRTGDRDFSRGIDAAERKAKALGRTIDNVGRAAQRLGRQLATFVTLPIIAIGVASVKTASDIQEMQNLFDVTFGEASGDVEEWATRTAAAMQRSRFEFQQTAAEFAAFLKPLGVAPDAIVPMSKALTALTSDIASFRNQTEEEVFTRLFSGLAGETEAVRRLGIDIGQAALEQELLNLGLAENITQATQAEKVMARFSLIMRQTSDAQGDAERTAFSFQNQTKALGATIKDIRVEIGQRLLPIGQRLIQFLREAGQGFLGMSENAKSGVVAVVAFVAIIGPAIFALGLLVRALGFAIGGLAFIPRVLKFVLVAIRGTLIAIQVAVVVFLGFFSTIPGLIIVSLAAIVGSLFIFKDTVVGFFKGLVLAIKDAFVAGFNNLVVIPFQEALNVIIDALGSLRGRGGGRFFPFDPITVNDVIENSFKDDMTQVIAEATANGQRELEEFKATASTVAGVVKTKFGEIKGAIGDWLPDLELADFTLENMGAKFNELMAQFAAMNAGLGDTGEAAKKAGEAGEKAFGEFGTAIQNSVEDNMTQALSAVRSFGDAARAIFDAVLQAFIRFRIVGPISGFFTQKFGAIPGKAEGGRFPGGQPFIAGERGPEVVMPDRSGTVIPNHELGGLGGGLTQNFDFGMVFPPQLEAFVRNVAGPAGRDGAMQVLQAQRGRI